MSEQIQCVIDTGYEHNTELVEAHHRFRTAVQDAGVDVIGDRSAVPIPGLAETEVLQERERLEMIAYTAGGMALWLDGQPPRSRIAVAAGFAAACGIPIFGMRAEQHASTGEHGIPFNLMINAAIAYSRDPSFGYDDELVISRNMEELRDDIADFVANGMRKETCSYT